MAEQPKNQSCESCRYSFEQKGWGQRCRRFPPQLGEGDQNFLVSALPRALGWCGEYTPANPETVEEGAAVLARLVLLGDLTAARALADKLKEGV